MFLFLMLMGEVREWGSVVRSRFLCLNPGWKDSPQQYQALNVSCVVRI